MVRVRSSLKVTLISIQVFLLTISLFSKNVDADPILSHFPLSTNGHSIVDIQGNRFKLKAVNWWGASDKNQVVAGLDQQSLSVIITLIQKWKFNSVRLPFSNQMLHDNSIVNEDTIRANPQFFGLKPLEVYDRVVNALTEAGIAVILNNHTTTSEWCCNYDSNGLWHHSNWLSWFSSKYSQTSQMWQDDWIMMATRYRENHGVVAVDLRNEVRTMRMGDTYLPESPNWGKGGNNDWHSAAENAGNAILRVNPELLIVVEGINWQGLISKFGSGYRPHLEPVQELPIRLRVPNKLVYSVHQYSYTGPRHTGSDQASGGESSYGDYGLQEWRKITDSEWGYITTPEMYYTAPVMLSEFGVPPYADARAQEWFSRLTDYLVEKDIDFAFWPLNGNDSWGLLSSDWSQALVNDWRFPFLDKLLNSSPEFRQLQEDQYRRLDISKGDDHQSDLGFDWNPGASKGTCPPGFRLIGLSLNDRALCTDADLRGIQAAVPLYDVQANQETRLRSHGVDDWAVGFTKFECPQNYYGAGFSKNFRGDKGLLCSQSKLSLSLQCHTLFFSQGDQRASMRGGDFAKGSFKAQCANGEYLGGFAELMGKTSALLCCGSEVSVNSR
jgi:endoglucanase